jgi:hypothetical protein
MAMLPMRVLPVPPRFMFGVLLVTMQLGEHEESRALVLGSDHEGVPVVWPPRMFREKACLEMGDGYFNGFFGNDTFYVQSNYSV